MDDDLIERYLRRVEERYRRIAASITPAELHAHPEADLDDLFSPTGRGRGSALFLGYYGRDGILEALRRYGLLDQVARTVGCPPESLTLRLDLDDPFHHVLRLEAGPHLLVELRMHLQDHPSEARIPGATGFTCCEWLLLQHPGRRFTPERPRLPGQLHPGLGIGAEVQTLLALLTERLGRHGLLAYPAFYHTAAMYAHRFRFVDPAAEGRFRALRRDGASLPLDVVSWAVELGCVCDAAGVPLEWQAREEMMPVSEAARAYLESPEYAAIREAVERCSLYRFDLALLARRRPVAEREAEAIGRRAYEAARQAHSRGS
ncbi:MAG: hypothetical protein RMK29_19680 [Myxococcales bacterium]|nr:hypothetical protein [Myxococcota bacterium]MDW8283929.1 hypothetical protein [Myxococcales bacterium]